MSTDPSTSRGNEARFDVYQRLAALDPAGRAALVLRLLEEHPQGHLVLPACASHGAVLDDIDLGRERFRARHEGAEARPPWWNAERQAVVLRHAVLRGASLRHADLHGALLEEADLEQADLAG